MKAKASDHSAHILPLRIYLGVGFALFILTGITVMISFVDLGGWNVTVALAVASIKAALVVLFFMHLLYDNKIYLTIFLTAIGFLAILIIFTMFDTMERGRLYPEKAKPIKPGAAIYEREDSLSSRSVDTTKTDH
ncbi:MAG: hypothetical protein GF315_06260 [candidate division Zixibacteria bacterium]|nr:hypothetical protein [candidate division Zixibacteria bacterium]